MSNATTPPASPVATRELRGAGALSRLCKPPLCQPVPGSLRARTRQALLRCATASGSGPAPAGRPSECAAARSILESSGLSPISRNLGKRELFTPPPIRVNIGTGARGVIRTIAEGDLRSTCPALLGVAFSLGKTSHTPPAFSELGIHPASHG
ncbi:hypothetical protein PsYK624_161260 [Phanerochaete sordida]|uniref:Uncharacterized protein n=1 Tax=Phanerochaete sordida TaxID=48140 RepID=A0A9P3LN19_9APHY|nr:hypothetical protein PsYK624_161260 [Phanerochaete sordida]